MDFTGWFYETVQKDEGFYEQGRPGPRRNARRRDPEELVEPVVLQLEWYYVLEGIMGIEALRKVEAVLAGPADSPLRSREELKKLIEGCLREAVVSSHVAFSGGNNYRIRKTIAKAARQDRDELADDILARALAGPARIRELLEDEYHYGTAVQELETFVRSVYDLMMLEDVAHDEEKLHAEEKRGMGVPYILKVLQNSEVHSALSASGMSLEKLRAAAREALQNENAGKAGPFKAPGIGGGAQRVPVPPKGSKGAPTEVVSDGSDDDEPKRPAGKGGKRGGRRIIFSSDDDEYAAPPEPKSKPKPKPPPANTKPGLVKALNNNASKAPAAPPVQYGGPPADRNQWNTPGGPRNPAAAAIAGNPDAQHQAKKQKVDGKKGLAGSVDAFRQAREWPGVMSPVQTSTAVAKSSRVVSTEPDPHYTLVLHDKRPAPKPSQGAYLIDSDEEGKEPPQKRPKVVLPVENDYTKSPFFRK
ncbi:hypothetical protein DFJ74DRAFT_679951 [Hyaloraphidium curvatum]|nr:hypothetical protein DFJ74DRAFT_679951 [Hyaloraphidium curvatum]